MDEFKVALVGIVFNPAKKQVLIAKRLKDKRIEDMSWCFPGGKLSYDEPMDSIFKQKIFEKTGYGVKNLGAIFAAKYPIKKDFLGIYFLAEVFEGEENAGNGVVELKWVSPDDVEEHFGQKLHPRLHEYLMSLK